MMRDSTTVAEALGLPPIFNFITDTSDNDNNITCMCLV